MILSKYELSRHIRQLPISYYLKRKVKVLIEETDSSFYDLLNDEITISLTQLKKSLSNIHSTKNIEMYVRSMVYHEVAHAILTPTKLKVTPIINIFEDERIETLLNKYFANIEFKKLLFSLVDLNDLQQKSTTSKIAYFYLVVRFRIGDKKHIESVKCLIDKYKDVSQSKISSVLQYQATEILFEYERDINKLYNEITSHIQEKEKDNSKNNVDDSLREIFKELKVNVQIDDEQLDDDDEIFIINQTVENAISYSKNIKLERELTSIFSNAKKINQNNSSAICSYSGKFDAKNVARDDYRYFVQQNRLGHAKAYSKIKLNLFIDNSGSFRRNIKSTNELLRALNIVEKSNSNFEYQVITMGETEKKLSKKELFSVLGGNLLSEKIFALYNNEQDNTKHVVNIVLFDGDAFINIQGRDSHESCSKRLAVSSTFKAFNHNNCIIISNTDNSRYIEAHCHNAKVIYSTRYSADLLSNIVTQLTLALRI